MSLKLDLDSIKLIAEFEGITKAKVRDCIVEDGHLVFVVDSGGMGAAIGKNGSNIQKAQQMLGRGIKLVEHSPDVVQFTKNLLDNVAPKSIQVETDEAQKPRFVYLNVGKKKGLVIGRDGANLERIKLLLQRHHGIEDVIVR